MEEKDLVSPLLWNKETSSASSEDICDPNPGVPVYIKIRNKQINTNTLKKFSMSCYAIFLFVRLFTLLVYIGRSINCCTKEFKASFQCGDGAFVPYDMEVELVWLFSSAINIAICLRVIFSWHEVTGMKVLVRKLVILPGFWSLIFLFLVSCSELWIMTIKNNNHSFSQIASYFLFGAQNILITAGVAVLNYTEVSKFMQLKGYQRHVRILIKLTKILLFIEFFSLFLIATMQFGFQVTGLDHTAKASSSFRKVFVVMRRFGEVIYYYNIMTFLWKKLFIDNRDILSHMQLLHDYEQHVDIGFFGAAP